MDEQERAVTSDTEGPEKRTRQQLEKATISKTAGTTVPGSADSDVDNSVIEDMEEKRDITSESASLRKKRSHEEITEPQSREETNLSTRHHTRKRSRGGSEEDVLNNGKRPSTESMRDEANHSTTNGHAISPAAARAGTPEPAETRGEGAVEEMSSPKIKRTRLQTDPEKTIEEQNLAESVAASESTVPSEDKATPVIPPTSGFANTSAASPFASVAKSPTPEAAQTSSSAFASSTFGSLAGSATSGFAAVGKTAGGFGSGGSFASGAGTKEEKPPSSAFGGSLGQKSAFSVASPGMETSAFGSSTSGFGKLGAGSTFGGTGFSSLSGGPGLTSFASGKPSSSLVSSSKPKSTFGPTPDDEEGEDEEGGENEDESGFRSPLSQDSDKQDERFYHQDLETGEEDEQTEYTCRAKLYHFLPNADGKKEWRERGLGFVKLNTKQTADGEEDQKRSARLLMRADGSHRVILNTAVKKEFQFGGLGGEKPQGGNLLFLGIVDGNVEPTLMQLKVKQQFAGPFYEKVVELQESM